MVWKVVIWSKGGRAGWKEHTSISTYRTKKRAIEMRDMARRDHRGVQRRLKKDGLKYRYRIKMYEVKK